MKYWQSNPAICKKDNTSQSRCSFQECKLGLIFAHQYNSPNEKKKHDHFNIEEK